MDNEGRTDARFTALETQLLSLAKDVTSLATDLSGIMQAVKSQSISIGQLADNQQRSMRTDWPVVVSSVGVVVLIAGLVLYEPLRSMREVVFGHLGDGHPDSVIQRIDVLDKLVSEESQVRAALALRFEDRLDHIDLEDTGLAERVLNVEREIFTGSQYRSGRPVRTE